MKELFRFLWLFFLLLGIVVLPLAHFSPFVFEFEFTKFVVFYFFSIILLFFVGIHLITNKQVEFPPKTLNLPILLFLVTYIGATIFSINRLVSLLGYFGSFTQGLIYLFFLLVFFISAFILREDRKLILQTIFLSGIMVGGYGLWQYGQNYWLTHQFVYRIYSTIGQPNRLAFFLLAVFPIGFLFFVQEKSKWLKVFYGLGWTIILVALFLTFTRTAYATLVATLILMFVLQRQLISNLVKYKYLLFTVILGLGIFGYIFLQSLPTTVTNYSQSSLSLRMAEWQGSWNAVVNRLWWRQLVGYGPETVYFTFFKYRPAIYNQSLEESGVGPNQVRNEYLHLLSGIGIIGLLAYLLLYKKLLELSWNGGKKNPLLLGVFLSFVSISIYSLFYYQTDTVLPLFWILVGLVISSSAKNGHSNNIYQYSSKRVIGLLVILVIPVLFYALYRTSLAHYYASGVPNETNYLKATQLAPFFDVYQRNLSQLYMSEMLYFKDVDRNKFLEKFLFSKQSAEKALNISPLDIRNVRQLLLTRYYAGVNLDKKYQRENVVIAQKLVKMSPSDPLSWDLLGLVYLDLGNLPQAQKAFATELTLKNDVPGVYLHLGEVAKQEGRIDQAIEFYNKAIKLAPGFIFAQNELKKALVIKNATGSAKKP